MTLPLTTDTLRAAYDYLATTPPFNRWNMPDGEDVTFRVTRASAICGRWIEHEGKHTIEVSALAVGHTGTLMAVVAHEMLHLHVAEAGMYTAKNQHNAAFRKLALRVCAAHGFDPKLF